MAIWAFKHYKRHEGGISFNSLMFWFWIKVFQAASIRTKFSFPGVDVLQTAHGVQLLAPKVEGQEHSCFNLQLLAPKVEDQKPNALGLQLLMPKVNDRQPNALCLQLSIWKLNVKSLVQLSIYIYFFPFFYVNLDWF
jgi:hypothetical protein